jgi:hypothetical protein
VPVRESFYGLSPALIGIFGHRSSDPQEQGYEDDQHACTPLMFGLQAADFDLTAPRLSGIDAVEHEVHENLL